jgi:hypothetical protein
MIKVGDKEWDKLDNDEKIAYCNSLLNDVKKSREPIDLEWYTNHKFENGEHYMAVNTVTGSLEANPPKKRGEVRMVINKIRSTKRAIQNYVTRTQPKAEIIPGDTDEDTIKNARRLGKTLDFLFRKLHLEQIVSGVVDTGLSNSVGIVEVDWDENADGGIGEVRVRMHDPFDVYFDKRSHLYAGRIVGRFIAKAIVKSTDEVKADKRYDEKARKEVQPDEELAASRFKVKILTKEMGSNEDSKIPTTTVKEFHLWDDDKNSKGGHVKIFTYAGDQVLLEEDSLDKEYPIYFFQISMNPLKVYQRAWVTDAIPLNKAIDRTISQKIMYMNQALVFRLIAEKGHGVGVTTNEMGEVWEVNKGRSFQQMAMNPLPAGYDMVSNELNNYIEDLLGAHDAALGRMPTGARSGNTLEAIQAADANNLTGLTQSLESFLSVVFERMLDIVAKKYQVSRIVKIAEPEEGQEYIKVIGAGSKQAEGMKKEGATIITEDNEVIVKIGSWLGHTLEAKRETMMKLAEMGVLPAEEILRQFEFPNVEELSAKARDQRLEQGQMDLEIAGHAQGGQGGQKPQGPDMQALADKENMEMAQGTPVPSTEGADVTHTQAHTDFMQSDTFKQLPDEVKQLFADHVQGELGAHMGGQSPQQPQVTPPPQQPQMTPQMMGGLGAL